MGTPRREGWCGGFLRWGRAGRVGREMGRVGDFFFSSKGGKRVEGEWLLGV